MYAHLVALQQGRSAQCARATWERSSGNSSESNHGLWCSQPLLRGLGVAAPAGWGVVAPLAHGIGGQGHGAAADARPAHAGPAPASDAGKWSSGAGAPGQGRDSGSRRQVA